MRRTSSGILTMNSPLSENMTTMVKRSAMSVIGLILGMNFVSYHVLPLSLSSVNRVTTPAMNGMPR